MRKEFWIKIFKELFEIIKNQLEGQAIKLALKALLRNGTWIAGPKAWLIKFIIKNLGEEFADPFIDAGLREIGYTIDVKDGKKAVRKIEEAKNEKELDSGIDDIFN